MVRGYAGRDYHLGMGAGMKGTPWTVAELETLRLEYPHHSDSRVAEIVGRSEHAVQTKASREGMSKSPEYIAHVRAVNGVPWSADEIAQLRAILPVTSITEVARILGRSVPAIKNKADSLKIKKAPEYLATASHYFTRGGRHPNSGSSHLVWTQDEVDTVHRLYATHTAEQIAAILGRSVGAVRSKIFSPRRHAVKAVVRLSRCLDDDGLEPRLTKVRTRTLPRIPSLADMLGV